MQPDWDWRPEVESKSAWIARLERRDRRCHISRCVLPNGTGCATADPALSVVFARLTDEAWRRHGERVRRGSAA